MRLSRVLALLLCFIFCSVWGKTIIKDRFVFKVASDVFSLNDIKKDVEQLKILKCIFPSSLTYQIFAEIFETNKAIFQMEGKNFTSKQKSFFEELLPFYKLLIYSRSHEVVVNSALKKYFFLTAKNNNCGLSVFNNKSFDENFENLVRLEVFVRSRFLPSESQGKATAADKDKAVLAARNLIASINRQIDEETYW